MSSSTVVLQRGLETQPRPSLSFCLSSPFLCLSPSPSLSLVHAEISVFGGQLCTRSRRRTRRREQERLSAPDRSSTSTG